MKKLTLIAMFMAMISLVMMTACTTNEVYEAEKPMVKVTFNCSTSESIYFEDISSRAISANGKELTDLAVFDYVGGELKGVTKQKSTESNFGSPTVNLEYGEHRLVFVVSRGTDFSVEGGVCKWSRASDTFVKEMTLNVTSTTANQSVTLNRNVACLKLVIKDEIPATAKTLRMTPSRFYNDFSTISMAGVNPTSQARDVDISSARGQSNISLSWFTICPGNDEWNMNVTFTVLDSSNNEIVSYTKNSVPLLANRTTVVSGNCFDTSSSFTISISVNDTWNDDYNMDLY